jgi:hypothetical protein
MHLALPSPAEFVAMPQARVRGASEENLYGRRSFETDRHRAPSRWSSVHPPHYSRASDRVQWIAGGRTRAAHLPPAVPLLTQPPAQRRPTLLRLASIQPANPAAMRAMADETIRPRGILPSARRARLCSRTTTCRTAKGLSAQWREMRNSHGLRLRKRTSR